MRCVCLLTMLLTCQSAWAGGFRIRTEYTQRQKVCRPGRCEFVEVPMQNYGSATCLGLGYKRHHYIGLTAGHTLKQAKRVQAYIRRQWVPVTVLKVDEQLDLALIGFVWRDESLHCSRVSNRTTRQGEEIIAMTFESGVAHGRVTATALQINGTPINDGQFDHPIIPGDSGAGVLDAHGLLVGVLNWADSQQGQYDSTASFVDGTVVYQFVMEQLGEVPRSTRPASSTTTMPDPKPHEKPQPSATEDPIDTADDERSSNREPGPRDNSGQNGTDSEPSVTTLDEDSEAADSAATSHWWGTFVFHLARFAATRAGMTALGTSGVGSAALLALWLYRRRSSGSKTLDRISQRKKPKTDQSNPEGMQDWEKSTQYKTGRNQDRPVEASGCDRAIDQLTATVRTLESAVSELSSVPDQAEREGRCPPRTAPFPRKLDEARQLLELRESEGRIPVLDALRGVLLEDEIEKLMQEGDAATQRTIGQLMAQLNGRVDEIAPLSVREEDF